MQLLVLSLQWMCLWFRERALRSDVREIANPAEINQERISKLEYQKVNRIKTVGKYLF